MTFYIDRKPIGTDFSPFIIPKMSGNHNQSLRRAWESVGKIKYRPSKDEFESLQFKSSIYVSKDIVVGEEFNSLNLKIIRPGDGAPPYLYEKILGCISKIEFKRGKLLKLEDII